MNYKKNYYDFIYFIKSLNRSKTKGISYHRHHIYLKSMGGSNDESNIVLLTSREHFLAHYLLWKIFRNRECCLALNYMLYNNRYKVFLGDNFFKNFKQEQSILLSEYCKGENNPFFGKHHSEESKRKIRSKKLGQLPWNKGFCHLSEVAKKRIGEKNKKHWNDKQWNPMDRPEIVEKVRQSKIGGKNPNAKHWIVVSPDGIKNEFDGGIKNYLKNNKLSITLLKKGCWKGWKLYSALIKASGG